MFIYSFSFLCFCAFTVFLFLQMASTGGTVDEGEELEERLKAISDILKTNVSEEDRTSFQFLLRELQQQKAALQKKKFGNLLAKYGHAASSHFSGALSSVTQPEVFNVGSPSPQPSTSASRASKSKSKSSDTPPSKPPPTQNIQTICRTNRLRR